MEWNQKFSPALITSSAELISLFPVNEMPNKLAANVPNSIGRSTHSCSFVSFLIVSLIRFTSNPDSSSDLTIFFKTLISSFEILMW